MLEWFRQVVYVQAVLLVGGIWTVLVVVVRPAIKRKAERWAARRVGLDLLDCGCPADGRPVYGCVECGHTRCSEHRDVPHICPSILQPKGRA